MNENRPMVDEEKEKKAIEWENKVLSILMPSVGLIAFILGLVGFILVVSKNVGVAVFLIILAVLGLGGVAYGVIDLVKKIKQKRAKKEEKEENK